MALSNFVSDCNVVNVGGTEMEIYFTCSSELKNDPRSRSEMPSPTGVAGETNEIGENYDFTGAPTGEGFWRKMTIIADTGMIETKGGTKDGTTKIDNTFKFKLKGFGKVEKEFAEKLTGCCGLVMIIPDKTGVVHELGRKKSPATVPSFNGGTGGDFRGFDYEVMASGRTPRTINLTTFSLDLTPN